MARPNGVLFSARIMVREFSPFLRITAVFLASWLSGCSAVPLFTHHLPGDRAFIKRFPADANDKRLRLAIKDNIDMQGVVTTAGSNFFASTHAPAKADAACLAIAHRRNVQIVGKTNMTEFAVAPSGMNEYYGTPRNPMRRILIPGGSSSGSAVAVANGEADVAFGTDTAGSIRVPAACCGVVGLKTTFGLISIKGIYPVEPKHLDTVGPMGKDIARTVQGMDLLQDGFSGRYASAKAARPTGSSIRVGRLKLQGTDPEIDKAIDEALAKAGFQIVQLDDQFRQKWDAAKADGNTVAAGGAGSTNAGLLLAPGVSARTKNIITAGQLTNTSAALRRRSAWQQTLDNVFQKVDIVALPTLQKAPPLLPLLNLGIGVLDARVLQLQNTVAVNFAGNPALAMPIPATHRFRVPLTSLQLVGPRLSEAQLLNAGRIVEEAVNGREAVIGSRGTGESTAVKNAPPGTTKKNPRG
ncbi:MAG TPA: amidase [Chthoniobacterales bacterium]|nr:amidase [Chthoniobacterales bacterium]